MSSKNLLFTVPAVLMIGLATTATAMVGTNYVFSDSRTQQDSVKPRAERKAKQKSIKKTTTPTSSPTVKVFGGKNNDKPLYGTFVTTYEGALSGWSGPVQISSTGNHKQLTTTGFQERAFSGCYYDGKYLSIQHDPTNPQRVRYQVFDAETWTSENMVTYTMSSPHVLGSGLTYVPTTKTIYGMFFESTGSYIASADAQLGYVNPNNILDPVTIIGDMGVRMRAMASTQDGTLYGVAYNGDIYTIDKQTAAITKVSTIKWPQLGPDQGMPEDTWTYYGNDAAVIDYETGAMYLYYSDGNDDTFILKVDPKTGDATLLANYSYFVGGNNSQDMITGIYFKQKAAVVENIPLSPTGLSIDPVGTELKVKVSFTMPVEDINGAALTQETGWEVGDGTTVFASGKAQPGTKVTTEVAVPQGGEKTLLVYAVNGTAKSNPCREKLFVGPDTPVIAKMPLVAVSGQKALVRWNAPQSLNGGNLATPMSYKVVRMPDNIVVNDSVTGNTCVDSIANELKAEYTYVVTPKAGKVTGEAVTSRPAFVGSYFGLPHRDSFKNEGLFQQYAVIDANADKNVWWVDVKQGAAIYSSNQQNANDYLLVGPFKLAANDLYNFTMTAGGHSVSEKVAVFVGNSTESADSFATEVIPETELTPSTTGDLRLTGSFSPQKSGLYYFAIKACSRGGSQNLYVYDVDVTGISAKAPAAPVISTFTPKLQSAVFQFQLPALTSDSTTASGVTAVNVYRDNQLVATLTDSVTDGAQLTWEDKGEVTTGLHTYKFVAVNAAGEGRPAKQEVYRGLDIPGTPTELRVYEDLNTPGLIHLSWKAPQTGYHGGYINPDELTYVVDYMATGDGSAVVENIKATSYDIQLKDVNKQNMISASVYGVNAAGKERMSWATRSGYYGISLPLPLQESWIEMSQRSGMWAGEAIVEKQDLFDSFWDICNGGVTNTNPQDADGGYIGCTTQVTDGGYRIRSPRVDISQAKTPTLTFYYRYTDQVKEYRVEVLVDNQPVRTLKTLDTSDKTKCGEWIREQISLTEFKGAKYIQLAFTATAHEPAVEFACLDNVTISDFVAKDLAVVDFTAPVKGNINEEVVMTLNVRNNGAAKLTNNDWSVKLYKNQQVIAEHAGVEIAADATASLQLIDTLTVTDPTSTEYYAELVYATDERPENNRTAIKQVRLVTPVYPRVTDLAGQQVATGVELTWSDPSATDMPNSPVTESFEQYQKFTTTDLGNWRLHDGDQAPTVILGDPVTGVLDYPHIGEKMAWQVMDPSEARITSSAWTPRTGTNMLVSFQACKDGKRNVDSDDWLISPELCGKAQTLSFYARVGLKAYSPEVFDLMYSTTGNAVADFKPLKADNEVAYAKDWTEFIFDLPEGTRHFAIVHKSFSRLALLIDDITYVPAGSTTEKIELMGYNVYRDGMKLNSDLVGDTQYLDTDAKEGNEYTYYVTAVWNKGEAALSNGVTVNVQTGIDNATTTTVRIYQSGRTLYVDGGEGLPIAVYSATGACVAQATAKGHTGVPVVAPGVYLVKVGQQTVKIAVK